MANTQQSISLEESNRIRISLGLKPLVDDNGPANDAEDMARKRQEMLDNADKTIQAEYTQRDLVGLKVSHDLDEMDQGETRVFTLKDSLILNHQEDELQNIEMAEEEQTKRRKELQTKPTVYTGYDDEQFSAPGIAPSVLAKYDEVIDGVRATEFRLGSQVTTSTPTDLGSGATVTKKTLLSIQYAKNIAVDDYLQEDVCFKKNKTKKKRPSARKRAEAHFDDNTTAEIDKNSDLPRVRDLDSNFVDDEELQAALARSRQAKIREANKSSLDQIATRVLGERAAEATQLIDDETVVSLVFDDTSQFVQSIQNKPAGVTPEFGAIAAAPIKQPPDVSVGPVDAPMEGIEAGESAVTVGEANKEDVVMKDTQDAATSLQQNHSTGMASTLSILRQQGTLSTPTAEQIEQERTQLQRDLWLSEQRVHVAQRELKKRQRSEQNTDQATREYDNRVREQQEARDRWDAFKDYKPPIDLTEYDEFGRPMTRKEAWKALSHRFHGRGSGKKKTEKRLKRIANEKKLDAMVSGDTPLNMIQAFQRLQEKSGQAHLVFPVGNWGAVLQAAEHFDSQPLAEGESGKTAKKKPTHVANKRSDAKDVHDAVMDVPAAIIPVADVGSTSLMPGFSWMSISAVEGSSTSQDGPTDRTKVAFG